MFCAGPPLSPPPPLSVSLSLVVGVRLHFLAYRPVQVSKVWSDKAHGCEQDVRLPSEILATDHQQQKEPRHAHGTDQMTWDVGRGETNKVPHVHVEDDGPDFLNSIVRCFCQ